jgi:hypothetical protein
MFEFDMISPSKITFPHSGKLLSSEISSPHSGKLLSLFKSESVGADPEFSRRTGTDRLHGMKYEIKMAAFLFTRSLQKTEEFRLASNVDGFEAFDDMVLRYRLREPEVWKTCFIQLKHKKTDSSIPFSSLVNISGEFSLFKYFE